MLSFKLCNVKTYAILFAVFLYSFSKPFPSTVSFLELSIFVFLVVFSADGYLRVFLLARPIVSLAFCVTLFIPLFVGLYLGNKPHDVIRDLIPLFYFYLAFVAPNRNEENALIMIRYLPFFLVLCGLVYSLRELLPFYVNGGGRMLVTSDYFIQSPAVLFSAAFLLSTFFRKFSSSEHLQSVLFLLLFLLPVMAFYKGVLRAPLFLSILFPVLYYVYISNKKLIRLLCTSLLIFGFVFVQWGNLISALELFVLKQQNYGSNGKVDELLKVFEIVFSSSDLGAMLFGKGWGGVWYSPAVGLEVRYTHSLFTFMLLKMGLIGVVLFAFLLFSIASKLWKLLFKTDDPYILSIIFSVVPVLIVNIFLESAYKTLDFGVILLLLFTSWSVCEKVRCYAKTQPL